MNPLLSLLGGVGGTSGGGNPMKQALMAMISGQKAEDFMANLSKTDSRFKDVDFNHLETAAHNLCQQKGVDENALAAQVQKDISNMM